MANARDIKSFLKENGIDTKGIRISTNSSINVKILDPKLDFNKIEKLLKDEYESYQRDEGSGEILSGGNTFVFIEYDYDLVKELSQELHGTLRPFLERCTGRWSIPSLVQHYVDSQSFEYDKNIVRRSIQESIYAFFRENPSEIEGLTLDGWN